MGDYHLRRQDREIKDEAEIRRILKACRYATVAMAKGGEPYLVTMNYGYDEIGGRLYFHCALKGQKTDFLEANENVCASIILDGGYREGKCEHVYSSLIIRGTMGEADGLEDKKHGLEVLLRHQEKEPDPILARNISNDASYDKVAILRLSIREMSAKQGQ
jgi:uncharacterized protein